VVRRSRLDAKGARLALCRHPGFLWRDAATKDRVLNAIKTTAEKLVDLLDYVEQVVRLDERVAFRLADYRLPDGAAVAIRADEIANLPGVSTDLADADGPIWLSVERLARAAPPPPPQRLSPWLLDASDPQVPPALRRERLITVTPAERGALIAAERAGEEDFAPVPARDGETSDAFDLRLRLEDQPGLEQDVEVWRATVWQDWADGEATRRRTIAVYGQIYRLQQQLELGGGDSAVEVVWGIGTVRWQQDSRTVERPLIDCGVEIELAADGRLVIRPTDAEPRIDLKPYEEMGCENLGALSEVARREVLRAEAEDGLSPFRPDSFEPLLAAAAARLAPDGRYRRDRDDATAAPADGPLITGDWVLYARPRSHHVVLDDIARFRAAAQGGLEVTGLAQRLVTPPAEAASLPWDPLGDRLGEVGAEASEPNDDPVFGDVFFPKPFNEEQVAIVRRLAEAEGLVVQGPPGTGKTHTIANLICHGLALGQRVLVVSRGEAALSVLRDQLPEKVRPLTIAILSSERQGLRQVEGAIREIQSVVEESRPEIRLSAIRRCEAEIIKIRARLAAIDRETEEIAALQDVPLGPQGERPAALARRVAAERGRHPWFADAPRLFVSETGLLDENLAALRNARASASAFLDHLDTVLPGLEVLPSPEEVAGWHDDLIEAKQDAEAAVDGPLPGLRLPPAGADPAARVGRSLDDLAAAADVLGAQAWLVPIVSALLRSDGAGWTTMLRDLCSAWWEIEAERVRLAPFAIDLPDGIAADPEACGAIERAARGDRLWPRLSIGHAPAKDRVAAVLVRGQPPGQDGHPWAAVAAAIALAGRRVALAAQWRHFAIEAGHDAGQDPGGPAAAARMLAQVDGVRAALVGLEAACGGAIARALPAVETLASDPGLTRALAAQLRSAAGATRLASVADAAGAAAALFPGQDRTATMARQLLGEIVGRDDITADKVAALWATLRRRIGEIGGLAAPFAEIRRVTALLTAAGAPLWAERLRVDPDPTLLPEHWRDAWDAAAAEHHLDRIDGRDALLTLAREREAADKRGRKLFVELVRERAFLALERRLSPRVKSALVEYVRALGRLGKGTGKGAGRHRRSARDAMARCYDAVPCWIMPTWRVAEQLPSDMAAFDLVILDEASQSDITELPALLRGRKILAVGDDRQVSPTPPFVTQSKIEQLRHHHLRHLPYQALLEPGESLYDLMRAVFPDNRLMLREHFRCVEPIIRFSMQFYPEKLVPLRVPAAAERFDPPLVDIFVPHGTRDGARKINRAEADVIVDEIAALVADSAHQHRSIGVISLIGSEQAELVRVLLTERIGEEAMQRHAVLCGNPASFQGNERDVVFLSMVADRKRRSSLTMLRYEQRFNVAASRARDRLVLVRSVERDDLAAHDLKARLIAHFEHPMPARAADDRDLAARCDSDFERDMLGRLVALGYRVTPQVGSEGFRIDLVVEDLEGRRLAVECDGDSFHGPERWRDDMRRQRTLERVGWRFWRCFASSFYRDPDGVVADLVATLDREGIVPVVGEAGLAALGRVVEHRVATAPDVVAAAEPRRRVGAGAEETAVGERIAIGDRLAVGDRVALLFPDRRRLTLRLTEGVDDHAGGLLSIATPLGEAVARSEEGDEIEVPQVGGGAATRVLVEAVEKAA